MADAPSDLDIHRAAHAVIKGYGDGAELYAAQRADELTASGDMEGRRVWQRIEVSIRELRKTVPGKGEAVH